MKLTKTFKRIASMGMALAMAMSCAAISAGAADTSKYTATADVYVAKADNFIKLVDAHLTDTSVPPVTVPKQNGTVEEVTGGYNVTVQLNNETFELKTIEKDSKAIDAEQGIEATGAKVVTTSNVTSKSGERIQIIKFFVPELNKVYKFDATQYVNKHVFTIGHTGPQSFPISVKISDLKEAQ